MNCPSCKMPLSDSAQFCPYCGLKLPPKSLRTKRLFGIFLILGLMLILLSILFWSLIQQDPSEKIVQEQLHAIQKNQLTEAYYAYTSNEFQAATSLEDFKKFVKSFPTLSQNVFTKLENLEEKNNLKIIKGTFKGPSGEILSVNYQLMQVNGEWKILNIKAIPSSANEENAPELKNPEVWTALQRYLNALDNNEITQVYEKYTAPEFKETTSFKAFKDFLSTFTILTEFSDYDLLDLDVKDEVAIGKIKFSNAEMHTEVNFTLNKNKENWLVRGIQIISQEHQANAVPDFNPEELLKVLKEQLQAVREGHFKEAYRDFTAEAFREATSFDDFEKFMKIYPVFLKNRKSDFYKLSFNNNIGIYNARLTAETGEEREVEYSVIKEKGVWKILQVQVFDKAAN